MKVFVYGAGVLGSLYAARLQESGNDVTILARGDRLKEIQTQGIVLEHVLTGERTTTWVNAVEKLEGNDNFDLILVIVRKNQVSAILPALSANKGSSLVLFMVNNPSGYTEWIQAVGKERLLIGFPGAGGTRTDGVVRYHILEGVLQPTTFGELDGCKTERLKMVESLFQKAGFPTALCTNMSAWQKYHVAWVSPLANALYMVGVDGHRLARRPDVVILCVQAIREGFKALKSLGFPITPAKLKVFEVLPISLLGTVLRL